MDIDGYGVGEEEGRGVFLGVIFLLCVFFCMLCLGLFIIKLISIGSK